MDHTVARLRRLTAPAVLTMVCVLGVVGAVFATASGTTLPQIVLQQSGHWVVAKAQQKVLHVHGGTQEIDARVTLRDDAAQGALMALGGETNGFVVGRGRAWSFDESALTGSSSVALPVTDERPVGIETVGGPYLVYRGRGTIVRLGTPSVVVEAGGPVGAPVWTSDGTVWVHRPDTGALCAIRQDAVQLDCSAQVPAGTAGGLTVIGDRAAFADDVGGTIATIGSGGLDAGATLGADLPTDTLFADRTTPTRLPVVLPATDVLRLLDVTGVAANRAAGPPLDHPLGAGTFSAPVVSGDVIAVLEATAGTLLTFDSDGHELDRVRLPADTDPSDLHRGSDGHIYVDQSDGAEAHVVGFDGKITRLGFDLGSGTGGSVAVAASDAQAGLIVPPAPGVLTRPAPVSSPVLVASGPGPGPGSGSSGRGSNPVGGIPIGGNPIGGNPIGGDSGTGGTLPPPAPPIAVVAQLTGPTEATVTWHPGVGGGAATLFTVTGSGGITKTTAADNAVFDDLGARTTYTFKVTATNSAGSSEASPPSNPVTTPGAIVIAPAAPPGAFSVDRRGCSLDCLPANDTFSWTEPDLGGGTLVNYVVSGTQSGHVIPTRSTTNTSVPYVGPEDFNPCAPANFQVVAVTRPPGGGDTVMGKPATLSSQYMICSVEVYGEGAKPTAPDTVSVSFNSLSSSDAATCTVKFDGATKWTGDCKSVVHGQVNVEIVTGLSPGTTYTITISVYGEIPGAWADTATTDPFDVTTPTS